MSTKNESFHSSLLRWKASGGPRLPACCAKSGTIGFARAIDWTILETPLEIELLVQWRERYRDMFLSRFHPDPTSTSRWLRDTVLPSENRILFWVEDQSQAKVGHYGLKGLDGDTIELDNGIRGVPGHPGLFKAVETLMLALSFDGLGARKVKTSVLADNIGALRLHHSLGMRIVDRIPLRSKVSDSVEELVPCQAESSSGKTHELVVMEIDIAHYEAPGIFKPDWRSHAQ